jgi:hypothetical protein
MYSARKQNAIYSEIISCCFFAQLYLFNKSFDMIIMYFFSDWIYSVKDDVCNTWYRYYILFKIEINLKYRLDDRTMNCCQVKIIIHRAKCELNSLYILLSFDKVYVMNWKFWRRMSCLDLNKEKIQNTGLNQIKILQRF